MDANEVLAGLEIAHKIMECRETAKDILQADYDKRIKPFKAAITGYSHHSDITLSDAALLIAKELGKTGHATLLVFSALADVMDEAGQ